MACQKSQTWITSVVQNEFVPLAVTLSKSLRRTKTTKDISVVTSSNVSVENRCLLQKAFDMVFLMDESCFDGKSDKVLLLDAHAKMYGFSLTSYKKCVYISASSIVLENSDNLFDSTDDFQFDNFNGDSTFNLSVYMFTPCKEIWNKLRVNIQGISDEYISFWLQNNKSLLSYGDLPNGTFAKFCVSSGKLITQNDHMIYSPIIHFVNMSENKNISEELKAIVERVDAGLPEKIIAETWLKLHNECLSLKLDHWITFQMPKNFTNEPIAIVGMSCRYPNANSLAEFWKLMYAGEEGIREVPAFRWAREHTLDVTAEDRKTPAGFLSIPVDEFDAGFFGISPKEAVYMDPQIRILHEVLWESLEDAGIDPLSLHGSHTGIFTGSWMNDYKDIVASSAEKDFFRTYLGNSMGAASARLSFLLGLTGPSIATESGCSSAIVALHLAIKSLRDAETNLALVGGVNLFLRPFTNDRTAYVISPNGRCKTFDAKADGFGRAEGCGVLVLKRLSDAIHDQDNIWAVIRGSAVSQEGISKSLGRPTVQCEALAMKLAMKDADVHPEQVSFVETHGTGTQVGDPMEVAAIQKAYSTPNRKEPLIIGSVKTNVGHTESCSGITGIMKAVLALQHELIPKHLNLETLNPEIFLDSIPATIPLENVAWPKIQGQPRICGVSSFGITGTDGHVIIEESPDYDLPKFRLGMERPTHLMIISGKSKDGLEKLLNEYKRIFSESDENDNFENIAYSANTGRASFNHRAFLVADSCKNALEKLNASKYLLGDVNHGDNRQICFLFTGQGSQYPGMAKSLYDTSPVFRVAFDRCDRTLKETYNLSIRQILWESEMDSKELSRTIFSQTSIFCVEYCLLKLWESWGIKPGYVLGHSLGEFCAAVAAGVLDFEDALKLVAERSRLIDNLPQGSMLVIKASKPEVEKWMKVAQIDLDFAALNYSEQTVVAGDTKAVESFMAYLKSQDTKSIILQSTHAFHSRHMDPMLEQYRTIAQSINFKQGNPQIQFISGMEGRIIDNVSEIGANYWVRHTREKVSFVDACHALRQSGCQDFLEVGPQPVLSSFVMSNNEGTPLNCFPSLRKGTNEWDTILTSLGKLYLLGYQVNWKGYDNPYIRKRVSLPFHPFHRKSFWVNCASKNAPIIHPLLGCQLGNASTVNIFQQDLIPQSVPYLKDHCIGNRIIFPGAGYAEMCLSAGYCVANGLTEALESPGRALRLENLTIDAPLELKEDRACRLQAITNLMETSENSKFEVKIFHQNCNSSEESGKWVSHASATFSSVANTKECMKLWNPDRIQELLSQTKAVPTEQFYKYVDEVGLKFGESFRMLKRVWAVKQQNCKTECDEILSEMELPTDWNKYLLHPLIIDAVFQTGILARQRYSLSKLKVPVRMGGITLFTGIDANKHGNLLYFHTWKDNEKQVLFISTSDKTPIAFVEDVELVDTTVATIESVLELQSSTQPDCWEETWKVIPGPFSNQVNLDIDNGRNANLTQLFLEQVKALGINSPLDIGIENYQRSNRLVLLYILNAVQQLGWKPEVGEKIHVTNFCSELSILPEFRKLVGFYLSVFQEDGGFLEYLGGETWTVIVAPPESAEVLQEINCLTNKLKETKEYLEITKIHENIARNLCQVLIGKQSGLNLLFPADEKDHQYSADMYYQCHPSRLAMASLVKLVLTNALRKSEVQDNGKGVYRVLEVGAGTGSLTGPLLICLREVWGTRFELWYTDVSQSFFIKAEQKFLEYKENIKFEVFNIEQSPLSQGIPLGYFDLVCATDVFHATRDLQEALVHLRQTLKPGGEIFFTETMIPARDTTFVFGLLEGYWRFEDFDKRPYHCCVGKGVWQSILQNSGFTDFQCYDVWFKQFGLLEARADPKLQIDSLIPSRVARQQGEKPRWVVFADRDKLDVMYKLANFLVTSGSKVVLAMRPNTNKLSGNLLLNGVTTEVVQNGDGISQIERILRESILQGVLYCWGMDLQEVGQTKVAMPFLSIAKTGAALEKPPKLYVVTQGVSAVTENTVATNPTSATLLGMAKSLKNERFDMLVRFVDLEPECNLDGLVSQVLYELAMYKGTKEQNRLQVAYRDNLRYEPRLGKGQTLRQSDELKLPPSSDKYHLVLSKSRMIQDLEFEPLETEPTKGTDIEVKVKAYALNFRDIFAILKPSKEFEKLNGVGLDFAGVVVKAGAEAEWKVGQRVFGCNYKDDQLASHLVVASRSVTEIPEAMTYWEASTLPAVFCTAYHCLINVAKMKKGDTVLIHTGSGGVGLAAIQLAKMLGAEIITTAGNPRKRAYLRSLGIQHVFHSRDTSYEQDILKVTNGKGVDIVLNSITGPGIKEATLKCTAKNGSFVEMSKLSVWKPEEVKVMRPDVDYKIVDLTTVDQNTHTKLLEQLQKLLSCKQLKALPFVKFDALCIRQALQYFQKARHIGKVVVVMPETSIVEGHFKTEVPLFNGESTYLITGGLGGIGFEVCKWMLGLGATDIVLTGRRPPAPEIEKQIKNLQERGFDVKVKLSDIGSAEQCHTLFEEIHEKMKPLRGVMHCAGVLRDNLYQNQSWAAFQATFHPKVQGTWNLHELTKQLPLEHFVVFSSATALMGTPAQPNHAAANCFEDAFIHYRHSLGLPGLTINWASGHRLEWPRM